MRQGRSLAPRLSWTPLRLAARSLEMAAVPSLVEHCVLAHHFNHAAELVLPWSEAPTADAASLLPAPACYWHVSGPLVDLLSPEFVAKHVRVGNLLALSATAVDQAGSLAITHPGKLLILCDRHVYESLGLTGLPSSFSPDKACWCVLVDLFDARVAPGGRDHERVTAALRRLAVVQLLLVWHVDGEAREPTFPAGITATRHETTPTCREFARLAVPDLRSLREGGAEDAAGDEVGVVGDEAGWGGGVTAARDEEEPMATEEEEGEADEADEADEAAEGEGGGGCEDEAVGRDEAAGAGEVQLQRGELLRELHEWLGMVALDLRPALYSAPQPAEPQLSQLRLLHLPLAPPKAGHSCHALRWRGMLAPSAVHGLLTQAVALVERGAVPWAALSVWGFADAPVSWGLQEHRFTLGGAENDYVVVVLPGGRCVLRHASCGSTRDFVCDVRKAQL